jgi:galactofuranose transport system substrate-binding protein
MRTGKTLLAGVALLGAVTLMASGCGSSGGSDDGGSDTASGDGNGSGGSGDGLITVGFAQTGSESGWRSANTESMRAAFSEENGFELIFNAADNDPAAQISAVRSFINQGVDAIVIAPIVEDGWDDLLKETDAAEIPVVLDERTWILNTKPSPPDT